MNNELHVLTRAPKARIAPEIYGHFAEHLGRCIYEGFWVGEDSSIPNTRGIRNDVVEALKKLNIPVLRWPGGCFADEYHWKDGIGAREERKTIVNTHWGGETETNHFGTHEFFDLCELLDTKPYICGNVGSGTVQEMSEWVEYITFDGTSPMADLRRKNGRDKGWDLPFFGVGNENWGCGGNMRAEFYADLYRQYATYVRKFRELPSYKIAGGANADDYKWTEVLMREGANFMNGLSLHFYTVPGTWKTKGSALEFDESDHFTTIKAALKMEELLQKHGTIMDVYDPKRHVGLIVDEWGTWFDVEPGTNPGFLFQQNTMRDALVACLSLNLFHDHAHRVKMANIAQTVNVLQAMVLTDGAQMLLTPTYHVFEMMKENQGATSLTSSLNGDLYTLDGKELPALHTSASRVESGEVIVNIAHFDPNRSRTLSIELHAFEGKSVSARVLSADSLQAHNNFDATQAVEPREITGLQIEKLGDNAKISLEIPPASVVVLKVVG